MHKLRQGCSQCHGGRCGFWAAMRWRGHVVVESRGYVRARRCHTRSKVNATCMAVWVSWLVVFGDALAGEEVGGKVRVAVVGYWQGLKRGQWVQAGVLAMDVVGSKDGDHLLVILGNGGSSKDVLHPSNAIMKELGVYMVGYDRAGYGESDPNPKRSPKSEAYDVEELADALNLGSRFYLIGFSLGGHAVWGSTKYIPGRLAGVALLAPVVNYRWPGFPKNLSSIEYKKQHVGDQWAIRVAYYAPWLIGPKIMNEIFPAATPSLLASSWLKLYFNKVINFKSPLIYT